MDGSAFVDLPSGFTEKIEEHIKLAEQAMKGFDSETDFVYNMNAGQLQDLSFILTVLNNSISKANQMAVNRHFAAVDEAAEKTIAELGTLGGREGDGFPELGKYAAVLRIQEVRKGRRDNF